MNMQCDVQGCAHEAVWRQYDPVDPDWPVHLCTPHWNETRILDTERALRYGAFRLFPEGDDAPSP